MRVPLRLALLIAVAAPAAGCGVSGGFLRDAVTTQRFDYQMRIQSLRVVRLAEGSAEIGSIFCVIPVSDRMYARAMAELHAHAKLQANEVLGNLREDTSTTWYLGFYCSKKLTISADVIQIVPEGGGLGYTPPPPPPPPPAVP